MTWSGSLGDALEELIDHRGKTPRKLGGEWSEVGVPVYSAKHVQGGRLDASDARRVSSELYRRWMPVRLAAGDVLLTSEAPLGEVAYLDETADACLGQRLFGLRGSANLLVGRYLYYLLQHVPVRAQILGRASGTTVSGIRQAELVKVRVELPPIDEQRVIADVLGALDDKIESNRRIATAVPEVIRLELDAREEPSWVSRPVGELARFVNGGAYTKGASGTGRMVIRIAELTKGPGSSTVYNDIDVPDDKVARAGDVLMPWSGSLGVHLWSGDEAIINQHIFKVVMTKYPAWLVMDRLERVMPTFRQIAADKATTMGHIKRHHLDDTVVPIPDLRTLDELRAVLNPLWNRRVLAEREARTLVELRDALLPELLSGRLRVPTVERSGR